MASGAHRGSKILLCLGLFTVVSSFCSCTKLTRLKTSVKFRQDLTLNQSQGKSGDVRHGRLLIGQNSLHDVKRAKPARKSLDVESDYQADMGWDVPKQAKGLGDGSSKPDTLEVERLLRMEPKVECTGDSMKLEVQDAASTPGSLLFVDRGRLSPLPLSKLPPSCGYTIRSTRRDMLLVAPYDGCFVTLEEDGYVLPLRWWGLPVRMSCPSKRQPSNPPMVTCHPEGMVVKTEWTVSDSKIKVNLNGSWEMLTSASPRCGISVVVHPEGVVISIRYAQCVYEKDGMYTIELSGDGESKISCPSLSPARPESTKSPTQDPKLQPETPTPTEAAIQKPNQGSHDMEPHLPYWPSNSQSVSPGRPTLQPIAPPTEQPVTSEGQVHWPSSPTPQSPPEPEMPKEKEPSATQTPNGQGSRPPFPYPFYIKPNPETVSPVPRLEMKPTSPGTQDPNHQHWLPYHHLPFYYQPPKNETDPAHPTTKPLPSKWKDDSTSNPSKSTSGPSQKPVDKPSKLPEGQGSFYQYPLFAPFLPHVPYQTPMPPLERTSTSLPNGQEQPLSPSQPETPHGQMHWPFYPYFNYPLPGPETEPVTKPTPSTKPPQPEAPRGEMHQPHSPLPEPENEPVTKPTPSSKPPQPEAPQGQMHWPLYPYFNYPLPEPENEPVTQPTSSTKPPQPEAPRGEMHQPHYPLPEPENEPVTNPTSSPNPPQPEAPHGQMHWPLYPYFNYPLPEPENEPVTKPTPSSKPPQPEAPRGQMHWPLYPYFNYPLPEPENEPVTQPTAPTKPPQPEAPQGEMHQPHSPLPEPENEPVKNPTSSPNPPQPEAPHGQMHWPLYPYFNYPLPGPETEPVTKPTPSTKPPQPEAPRAEMHQPHSPLPEPENEPVTQPTAPTKPPQPEAPRGQIHWPLYPYYHYPLPEPENEPVTQPTASTKPPQPEAPQGEMHQPHSPLPEPENEPVTNPTPSPNPPQPEAPHGQMHWPLYPYFNYPLPEPETEPVTKPTPSPKPPQPEDPQGQMHQPLYPLPEPENEPVTQPTAPMKPPQPEATRGQIHWPLYPYFNYPLPEPESEPVTQPTASTKPPKPEAPHGQMHQPLYPLPQPENEPVTQPAPSPKPPQPEAPHAQMHWPHYPYFNYPLPEPESEPVTQPAPSPKPPQPEAPHAQMHWPHYPYFNYPLPEPESEPVTQPTASTKPPQPEAPQGQMHQPEPESEPVTQPAPSAKPTRPEAPHGQMHWPLYPYFNYPLPVTKPTGSTRPPQPVVPHSQIPWPVYLHFNPSVPGLDNSGAKKPTSVTNAPTAETWQTHGAHPVEEPVNGTPLPTIKSPKGQMYYSQQPIPSVPLPSASHKEPEPVTPANEEKTFESALPKPSEVVPQTVPYISPLYCPKFCPSGIPNCCPQIAFHQHLHHIVPAGIGSKDSPVYPGLPFLPSMAYSGFSNGFGSAPYPQKPAEETDREMASTALPTSPQSMSSGNERRTYLQPPDGNSAAPPESNPTKPANPEPIFSPFIPNAPYPYWTYLQQKQELHNLALSQSTQSTMSPKPQYPVDEPAKPVVQNKPYEVQPPEMRKGQLSFGNMNSLLGLNSMSHIGQYPQQHQKPKVAEELPLNKKSNGIKGTSHPKFQTELDPLYVPSYMLQDAQAPIYNKSLLPTMSSHLQQLLSGSKKLSKNEQPGLHSEPEGYVLLQHGPPGREPNSFDSRLPFRELVHGTNILAENHKLPQDLKLLRTPQNSKWQEPGMAKPLPSNFNYKQRLDNQYFVPLPQSFIPHGFRRRNPYVPGKAFQRLSSAANAYGLNQRIQKDG